MIVLPNQVILAQKTIKIDANMKEDVIKKVADFMKNYYVFAEIGEQMGEYIKTSHSNGVYNGYADVKEFCNKVTADLREISHDKHIFVFYSPEEAGRQCLSCETRGCRQLSWWKTRTGSPATSRCLKDSQSYAATGNSDP